MSFTHAYQDYLILWNIHITHCNVRRIIGIYQYIRELIKNRLFCVFLEFIDKHFHPLLPFYTLSHCKTQNNSTTSFVCKTTHFNYVTNSAAECWENWPCKLPLKAIDFSHITKGVWIYVTASNTHLNFGFLQLLPF